MPANRRQEMVFIAVGSPLQSSTEQRIIRDRVQWKIVQPRQGAVVRSCLCGHCGMCAVSTWARRAAEPALAPSACAFQVRFCQVSLGALAGATTQTDTG